MNRPYTLAFCCLYFGGIGLSSKSAFQDKPQQPVTYRLTDALQAGDVVDVTENMDMTISVQARVLTEESKQMPVIDRVQSVFRMNVVAADAKGNPTTVRMTTTKEKRSFQAPGGKLISRDSSAVGKTVTLKKSGKKTIATLDKGKLSSEDRKSLSDALNGENASIFPDYDLSIGEEWNLESLAFGKEFGGEGSETLTGRLIEVVQKLGRPCARAKVEMEFNGNSKIAEYQMTMKLAGDVYYALDIKRIIAVNVSGPVTITGEIPIEGLPVAFGGDGTARINYNYKWLKVAGKPVKPASAAAK